MTDAIETNLGRKPEQLSADAGYCSEAVTGGVNLRIDGGACAGEDKGAVEAPWIV
jgi:hypothetical protein